MTKNEFPVPDLTELEQRFVEEYCVDLAPKAAAIRAGRANSTASKWGNEMLRRPEIIYAIDLRREELNKQSIVSAEWVRTRFKQIAERCMQAEPVMEKVNGELVPTGEYKFDSNGANKALEHLGKHIGMFKDQTVVTIEVELKQLTDEQLEARRKALIEEILTLDALPDQSGTFVVQQPTGEANGEAMESNGRADGGPLGQQNAEPGDGPEAVDFIPGESTR